MHTVNADFMDVITADLSVLVRARLESDNLNERGTL